MTTPRPGSRAEQRRRTEARILGAAARVFVADGYERTTIRAVASAAGVDAGLVMHYFGSKQELFRRVIDAAPLPVVSGAPEQATEQILTALADRLASEPVASLTIFRSMLTNPEAASAASAATARYQAQIIQAIPSDDAGLRAAITSAIILGITVSRHLIKSDELASADPAQVIRLLRPCVLSLMACPDHSGPALARQRSPDGSGQLANDGPGLLSRSPAQATRAPGDRRRPHAASQATSESLLPNRPYGRSVTH
ncbi:MAG: TetR family transcriptional regulator [Streptosporangiaceae bacterium]|nr:TetR family transcriptional regulator [Streptosporangiaceae bacterium]